MLSREITIQPLGITVESDAKTYEELNTEYLKDTSYYFSGAPVGARKFGPLDEQVFIRQKTTLVSAIEELVSNDPIEIPIDPMGNGAIDLHLPVPRGFNMILREIHFSKEPLERQFYLNREGPIAFTYHSSKVGFLNHGLNVFGSVLVFSGIKHITKAIIYLVPQNIISAVEMFFPGQPNIQLSDYFRFREVSFKTEDGTNYSYDWVAEGRKLRSVELPTAANNWHVIVMFEDKELLLDNKNGISPVNVPAKDLRLVLVAPTKLTVKSLKVRLYYQTDPEHTKESVSQLKSELKSARKEINSLQEYIQTLN